MQLQMLLLPSYQNVSAKTLLTIQKACWKSQHLTVASQILPKLHKIHNHRREEELANKKIC